MRRKTKKSASSLFYIFFWSLIKIHKKIAEKILHLKMGKFMKGCVCSLFESDCSCWKNNFTGKLVSLEN